jgi:uncharacterized protein YjcR
MLNISEIIKRIGYLIRSQKNVDIAKALKVKPATSHNWVDPERNTIPWETLFSFCQERNISFDWLLTGKEPDTTVPSTYNKKNKELHDKVETILNSETTYSGALTDNIHAFHQAVEKDAEAMKYKKIIDDGKGRIESLERDNDDLKQEIIILKEAMKNIQIMHESPNTATGEGDGIKSGKKKT